MSQMNILERSHCFTYGSRFYCINTESKQWLRISKDVHDLILSTKKGIPISNVALINDMVSILSRLQVNTDKSPNYNSQQLSSLQLHVAHSCNLACTYCYANQGDYGGDEGFMDKKTAKQAIDFLFKHGRGKSVLRIGFFGGEPLLNFEVVRFSVLYANRIAKRSNISVKYNITTNGVLLSKKIRKFFIKHSAAITVSIDGNKETHDKNRPTKSGKGSYDKIVHNTSAYNDEAVSPAAIRGTYGLVNIGLEENYSSLNAISNEVYIAPASDGDTSIYLSMAKEQKEAVQSQAIKMINSENKNTGIFKFWIQKLMSDVKSQYTCGGGRTFLSVSPNGDLYFCHRFMNESKFKVGSIHINYEKNSDFSYPVPVKEKRKCDGCWANNICLGQCYQESYEQNGDIAAISGDYCYFVHESIKQTIHLLDRSRDEHAIPIAITD